MAFFTLGMFMDSSLSTGSLANWSQVLLAIKAVHSNQSRCRTVVRLATSTDTYSTKVFINDKNIYSWVGQYPVVFGAYFRLFYLSIVVTFNQEHRYTGIPVSIYVLVGCFIICDVYTIGSFVVIVLWKQCLRHGVVCSYDKNTNVVAHFIGSIYHVCICGYVVFFCYSLLVVFCSLLLGM